MSASSCDKQELIFDSGLPPFQDFALFHFLVVDSVCELSMLQNSTASPQGRSSQQEKCSLVLGERPPSTFITFYVAYSDNQDAQASTSFPSTAAPVQAPSLHANFPLRAPAGGNAVDSGGGEQPTPTPNFIFPFNILSFAASAGASQVEFITLLALVSVPPATPMHEDKTDNDLLQTVAAKARCLPPKIVVTPLQQQKCGVGSASGSTAAASDEFNVSCQSGAVSRAPPRPRWRWTRESPSAEGCQAAPLPKIYKHPHVDVKNYHYRTSRRDQALAPPPKQATPCKTCCVSGGWCALFHGGATHSAIRPARRTR